MNNVFEFQKIMFIIVPIISILIFILTVVLMFSSKFRGKLMSKQIKAVKNMTDYSKDDIENIMTNLGNISVNAQNNIVTENEETLKNIADKQANINKDSITTISKAIKDGFSKETIFCKHCGSVIDEDSTFCKYCGKEQ